MTHRPNDPAWSAAPLDGADPERLAALLDERLSGAERDELLARLAASEDDLALFAEAAAIQRELEAEDGRVYAGDAEDSDDGDPPAPDPQVLPLRRPARPARGLDRRWMAAAAAIAGLVLLPLAWRASQGGAVGEPAQAVAMLADRSGLPAGWDDDRPWSVTRGGSDPVSDESLSIRLGAYMVDLELSVRARDTANTRLLAQRVSGMLSAANTSGTMAAGRFDELAERAGGLPAELLPVLEDASDAAADAVDGDRFAMGAWVEAARIAAARRDAAFFRDDRTRRTLARAEELAEDNEEAQAALATIRTSLEAESILWPELEGGLDRLMHAMA